MEFIRVKNLVHKTGDGQGWFGCTHNINIYRGCHHGCIYCDSRSSCYQIHNFDEVKVKEHADIKIDQELSNKRKKGIISLGGMSDPYNRYEEKLQYTRHALESINKYGFGVSVITKSTLILRDIDILKQISTHSPVTVMFTITTSNDRLQKRIERNVSTTSERFEAIKKLREAGLFVGVIMMPILPFINDTDANIEGIVTQASEVGAYFIYPSFGVTLRDNQRAYFFNKIGADLTLKYIEEFGGSYMCPSPRHKELKALFKKLCGKYNLYYKMFDIIEQAKRRVSEKQITLF